MTSETQTRTRNEAATDLLMVLTQPGVIPSTRVRAGILRKVDAALREQTRITVEPYEATIDAAKWLYTAAEELNRLINGLDLERATILAPSIREAQTAVLNESRKVRAALAALSHDEPRGEER